MAVLVKNRKSLPWEEILAIHQFQEERHSQYINKNSSGTEVIDSKGKAAILNEQYDSVFTDENMNTMPSLGNSNIQDIDKLRVTENGKEFKQMSTRYKRECIQPLVRPHIEYASAVWDPYKKCHINQVEIVQRRAARFVTTAYSREPGTVTNILQTLGWTTLATRRKGARLILLYKILHGEASVIIPDYIKRPTVTTRQYHRDRFSRVSTSTDAYKYSFIPRTIVDWNQLPESAIRAPTTDTFRVCVWAFLT
ncbi:unnamed protein product [Mytilus coruscus]|uniref:Uncharacterized protein n=1 Tax=Mytilus coruscus TaxID=42192 RepID=A0A6J8E0A9_MYTCO|nr:unnamed protein product [Mytilus coruscus]